MIIEIVEVWDKVFLCLSHAPDLGFSMGQTANELNSQSDGKGDLASIYNRATLGTTDHGPSVWAYIVFLHKLD